MRYYWKQYKAIPFDNTVANLPGRVLSNVTIGAALRSSMFPYDIVRRCQVTGTMQLRTEDYSGCMSMTDDPSYRWVDVAHNNVYLYDQENDTFHLSSEIPLLRKDDATLPPWWDNPPLVFGGGGFLIVVISIIWQLVQGEPFGWSTLGKGIAEGVAAVILTFLCFGTILTIWVMATADIENFKKNNEKYVDAWDRYLKEQKDASKRT